MTYEDQIVEQVTRGNDLEAEVKWLKSDEYINGIKADGVESYVDSLCGNCYVKVYKNWIKKDGRLYADKLRNK